MAATGTATLNRLARNNPDIIEGWYRENDGGHQSYWIDLRDGWLSAEGTHAIHEDTVADYLRAFRLITPENDTT